MNKYNNEDNFFNNYSIADFASELNDLIRENRYLRNRVAELEQKDKERSEWIDDMYNKQRESVGNILGTLVSNLDD